MKKTWIIISILGISLIFGTIIYFLAKPEENHIIKLTGSELKEKMDNKETFILLISQENCIHCKEYKPVLERVLKEYNKTAYEIIWQDIRNVEELNKIFNISGTPTTVFINDGVEKTTINRLVGPFNYNELVEKLKDRNFIE